MPKGTRCAPASLGARGVQETILLVGEALSTSHIQETEEAIANSKGSGDKPCTASSKGGMGL